MKNENLTLTQIDEFLHNTIDTDWYGDSDGGYIMLIHTDIDNEQIKFEYYDCMCYEINHTPLKYEFEIAQVGTNNFIVSVTSKNVHGVSHFSAINELNRFIEYAFGYND